MRKEMNQIGRKAKRVAAKQVYLSWSEMLEGSVRKDLGRSAVWLVGLAVLASLAHAQTSFTEKVYPVLEKAGCRNCHNVEGVASATRLHFPEEAASKDRIEAFGRSLVEFVDRGDPAKSLLFQKPTLRTAHTGGERIRKGTAQEAVLRSWVDYLASLQGPELAEALRYRQEEQRGYGATPKAVLRRLTHAQYNNTVRDLLKDASDPASAFPTEDYVNGFKNQYEALSVSPILADAYSRAAERLAANAFRRGDSRGLIPCKPSSETDAACRTQFIQTFGRRAFRRPLDPAEVAVQESIFKAQKTFLAGAQAVVETMLQSPSFIFWLERDSQTEMVAVCEGFAPFIFPLGDNAGRRLAGARGSRRIGHSGRSRGDNAAHARRSQGESRSR